MLLVFPLAKKSLIYCFIASALFSLALFSDVGRGASLVDFYYYNPDSCQSNLGYLKREFDGYLMENGFAANFQPFTHFVDFYRLSCEAPPSFILVPEWYYRKFGKDLGLRPILVPERQGATSYKKILLVPKHPGKASGDQEILSFATTSMVQDGVVDAELEALLLKQQIDSQRLNVIEVPKDSDAILALVLGQVKIALVGEYNLRIISEINPKILSNVKQLQESITVPMPVLCYLENKVDESEVERLVEVFTKMSIEQPKNKIMEMLKIDNWKKISE